MVGNGKLITCIIQYVSTVNENDKGLALMFKDVTYTPTSLFLHDSVEVLVRSMLVFRVATNACIQSGHKPFQQVYIELI